MKKQAVKPTVESSKVASITVLFIIALLIIFLGAALSIYSVICNINFPVMNSRIHGAVWGAVIIFLGVRYLLAVRKLKTEVYKSTSGFSWSNFKTEKARKTQPTHR